MKGDIEFDKEIPFAKRLSLMLESEHRQGKEILYDGKGGSNI